MKDARLYVIHILECLSRIENYTSDGKDAFSRDTKAQDAALRNLQRLFESTQRLSVSLKAAYPQIDWQRISGFRNVLVEIDFGINLTRVWGIIEHGLPGRKYHIEATLQGLG